MNKQSEVSEASNHEQEEDDHEVQQEVLDLSGKHTRILYERVVQHYRIEGHKDDEVLDVLHAFFMLFVEEEAYGCQAQGEAHKGYQGKREGTECPLEREQQHSFVEQVHFCIVKLGVEGEAPLRVSIHYVDESMVDEEEGE